MPRPFADALARHLVLGGVVATLACARAVQPSADRPTMDPAPVGRPDVQIPQPQPGGEVAPSGSLPGSAAPPAPTAAGSSASAPRRPSAPPPPPRSRVAPPDLAYRAGWMPLAETGVPDFRREHPTYDGRGVLIGILDSGVDPAVEGLGTTSAGQPKLLDLRDFSGEGRITLSEVTPQGGRLTVAGETLEGAAHLATLGARGPVYAGVLRERPLGVTPASDLNGDGDDEDAHAVIVFRGPDGWAVLADTDGDGSLAGEKPVRDYLVARGSFGWHVQGAPPPIGVAVNLAEANGRPVLDLYFDTSGHGTHVAGIAAGHDMYGVAGFHGVAPGAQLLGLKISNNAQGGLTTTGSMRRAIGYAVAFARERKLPLVLNMSFGVGNEQEGRARIDSFVDSVLGANPDIFFTISAGNDGPGLSTVGFPGSSERAVSVGATFPTVFLPFTRGGGSVPIASFSSRGGPLAKPDLVTPGVAYATVPRWDTGDERKGGTSMAAPHAAGLGAALISGLAAEQKPIVARQVRAALIASARRLDGNTVIDEGAGEPELGAAWRVLTGLAPRPEFRVRAGEGVTAAFRTDGLRNPADTLQRFTVTASAGRTVARLRSDAPWLAAPASVTVGTAPTTITLRYRASALREPGVYVGTVHAFGTDSASGPLFSLVNTIVVPAAPGDSVRSGAVALMPSALRRLPFRAQAGRPFLITGEPTRAGQVALVYLHEPGGQPFRDEHERAAGIGEEGPTFAVDARDVEPGVYETVLAAPPSQPASAGLRIRHSPVTLRVAAGADSLRLTWQGVGAAAGPVETAAAMVGGERVIKLEVTGDSVPMPTIPLPAWARRVLVELRMPREQWPRFTDFGLSLFDPDGRQLGKSPLNYHYGRLEWEVPMIQPPGEVRVGLFPGRADADDRAPWSARLIVTLYGEPSAPLASAGAVRVPAGGSATQVIARPALPGALPEGYRPVLRASATDGGDTFTFEQPLEAAGAGR